jgi:nucleotide sugar dehydrogenase
MAKLLENSYRATNIAFIEEWARLAEQVGVDLFDVIRSVRVRKGTHDNMMLPGLGVGGYCLTKDALLAAWGAQSLLGADAALPFSRLAILTNERMPLRALEMLREHFGGRLEGRRVLLLGVTYRPDVADTRSSPAEVLARALLAERARVSACDPLVDTWPELAGVPLERDRAAALAASEAVVVCLPDPRYREGLARELATTLARGGVVIDPWNVVAKHGAGLLAGAGIALHVYGRGDVGGGARA